MYTCPVCYFNRLHYPPENHELCPSCGTMFGIDDVEATHAELRRWWIEDGATWFHPLYLEPQDWFPTLSFSPEEVTLYLYAKGYTAEQLAAMDKRIKDLFNKKLAEYQASQGQGE